MNSTNYGFQANTNDNDLKVNLNKSEKFQEAVNDMRLMMWKRYLSGVGSNPHITKKEVCHHLGLKIGTINSIQQYYKLQSLFYCNKPKRRVKRKTKDDASCNDKSSENIRQHLKRKKQLKRKGKKMR